MGIEVETGELVGDEVGRGLGVGGVEGVVVVIGK